MSARKLLQDFKSALLGTSDFSLLESSRTSSAYFLDLEFLLADNEKFFEPFDEQGIPLKRFPNAGDVYLPTKIAAYGLAHFNRFVLRGNTTGLEHARRAADWFLEAEDAIWRYRFDFGELKSPWISAMAQGEAISLLIRLYAETGESKYLEQSTRALEPLKLVIADGGVRSLLPNGDLFLEEYPTAKPDHTLNGFMYCLIGLIELDQVTHNLNDSIGLDQLIESLRKNIGLWDTGYWTTYDLHRTAKGRTNAATVFYHRLHSAQLSRIAQLTDNGELADTARRWNQYYGSGIRRIRALGAKVAYRLENPAAKK